MPRIHEIKCLPEYFEETVAGRKRFEIRKNDRGYKVGDLLAMNEHDGDKYTGRAILLKVDFMMNPNDVMSCSGGHVVMSVHPVEMLDEQGNRGFCVICDQEMARIGSYDNKFNS